MPSTFVLLEGGVLGRTDDMLIIRGVNVYPTAVEHILHGFAEALVFYVLADRHFAQFDDQMAFSRNHSSTERVVRVIVRKISLNMNRFLEIRRVALR